MSQAVILVAEDNDFVRMQIVKFLQDGGHTVVEARDGGEALKVVQANTVDLVIVDVRMEPMDGFDFMSAVRGMSMKMPFIMVTGDDAPDILEKSGDWNVSAVLIKPVQKARLLKAVERCLAFAQKKGVL